MKSRLVHRFMAVPLVLCLAACGENEESRLGRIECAAGDGNGANTEGERSAGSGEEKQAGADSGEEKQAGAEFGEEMTIDAGAGEEMTIDEGAGEEIIIDEGTGEEIIIDEGTGKEMTIDAGTGEKITIDAGPGEEMRAADAGPGEEMRAADAGPGEEMPADTSADTNIQETEIQVFIASGLDMVMEHLADCYQMAHPEITVTYHADSSKALLARIQEGAACDIFFSASQAQMDKLEAAGLMTEGSREEVVDNPVVLLASKDSGTKAAGLKNLMDAGSIALADGSLPLGRHTRRALVNAGILDKAEDISRISAREIARALGTDVRVKARGDKVLAAVAEGICEVGLVYSSDLYGYEEQVEILEKVGDDLTGNVTYSICLVENEGAEDVQTEAAEDFLDFVISDEAKEIFAGFHFDTDI